MKTIKSLHTYSKHFGTGVLIATAFVHLIPTAFQSLNDPCLPPLFNELYAPLPGVIMMGSLFILFVIEMWLHAKTSGHSHGGTGGSLQPTHAHGPATVVDPVMRLPKRPAPPSNPFADPPHYTNSSSPSTHDNWDEKAAFGKE